MPAFVLKPTNGLLLKAVANAFLALNDNQRRTLELSLTATKKRTRDTNVMYVKVVFLLFFGQTWGPDLNSLFKWTQKLKNLHYCRQL